MVEDSKTWFEIYEVAIAVYEENDKYLNKIENNNKREFEIKSKNSKLSVIDKLYVNGGLFFKKAVCRDSRQGVGYKVTE